jgi:hypothetical protein
VIATSITIHVSLLRKNSSLIFDYILYLLEIHISPYSYTYMGSIKHVTYTDSVAGFVPCGNCCGVAHAPIDKHWAMDYEDSLDGFLQDGILRRVRGWRYEYADMLDTEGKTITNYLLEFRLLDPVPGIPALYTIMSPCGEESMNTIFQRPPLYPQLNLANQGRNGEGRRKDVQDLLAIAWYSFRHDHYFPTKELDDWTYYEFQFAIDQMLFKVKWVNGDETWERGFFVKKMFGYEDSLDNLVPKLIRSTIRQWKEMQRQGLKWSEKNDTCTLTKRFGPAKGASWPPSWSNNVRVLD